MLYHKFSHDVHGEIVTELYDDEIITYCGGCNKEMPVEKEVIMAIWNEGNDFVGTTFYCHECSERLGEQNGNYDN